MGVTDLTPFWSSRISPSYSRSACSSGVVAFVCCKECSGFSQTKTSAAGLQRATSVSVSVSIMSLSLLETRQSQCSPFGEGPKTWRSNDSSSSLNSLVIEVVMGKNSVASSGEPEPSSRETRITPLSLDTRRNSRSSLGPTLLRFKLVKFKNSFKFFTTLAHFFSLSLDSPSAFKTWPLETLKRSFDVGNPDDLFNQFDTASFPLPVDTFFRFFADVKSSGSGSEVPSCGDAGLEIQTLRFQAQNLTHMGPFRPAT